MKGYKVFNSDWTCRGFQYEVGKTYEHEGEISPCNSGFHFCEKAADCFNYYKFDSNNKVAEVEALGEIKADGNKSVTDKIKIVRELSWHEVLELVNIGKDNTGLKNSGDWNSGDWNSGNWNSGNWNSGDCNTGNYNSGDCNSGNYNSGDYNSGNWNSGDCNTGNYNSGDCNSGNYNSGDYNSGNWNSGNWNSGNWNSGNWNSGNRNSGDCNSGNFNSGDWNSGYRNTGNFNSGDCNSGFFCTITPNAMMFNKPTEYAYLAIYFMPGMRAIRSHFTLNKWVGLSSMTDQEKSDHPKCKTCGGYLKTYGYKEAWKNAWDEMIGSERESVKALPNFDPDIFYEITGIRV